MQSVVQAEGSSEMLYSGEGSPLHVVFQASINTENI